MRAVVGAHLGSTHKLGALPCVSNVQVKYVPDPHTLRKYPEEDREGREIAT